MIPAFVGLLPHFAAVENRMAEALASREPRVAGLITDLGHFHGKMLRPALVLLVAETLGDPGALHYTLGAALELIHTATLIHDDLIDDSDTRRGASTAHTRFGNTTSVLLGDYFYTHAFTLVADLDYPELMRRLTRTTNVLCDGELHQQMAARDTSVTEIEYERIIYAKTACLTELAGAFGAAQGSDAQRVAAAAFGRACGMAFQISDDCLDFAGDPEKVGKTLSTDLERGRMTLPVLRWLAGDRTRAARLLANTSPAEVAALRAEIAGGPALASALDTARSHIADAKAALAGLPAGPARERLFELADFIVSRDH